MPGPVGDGNYEVQPGDCLSSIAFEHGFRWQTLWNLPENGELKRVRKSPHILLPGDRVFIPDIRTKDQSGSTDQNHPFVVKGVPELLQIAITDDEDQPQTNWPYTLVIDDGKEIKGITDGSGMIKHAILPNARRAFLRVGEGVNLRAYDLQIGHLDPVDETSGLQARLLDLGYYYGDVNGEFN